MKHIKTFENYHMNENLIFWIKNKLLKKKKIVDPDEFANEEDDKIVLELIDKLVSDQDIEELEIQLEEDGFLNPDFSKNKFKHKPYIMVYGERFYPKLKTLEKLYNKIFSIRNGN